MEKIQPIQICIKTWLVIFFISFHFIGKRSFVLAVLTNLEKINSLPMEMQTIANGQSVDVRNHNGHANKARTINTTPPPGMLPVHSKTFSPQIRPTVPLADQMKNLSVSSQPPPPTTTTTYLGEYEVVDTSVQSLKKPTTNVASFPPRQNTLLFTTANSINDKTLSTAKASTTNGQYASTSNDSMKNKPSKFQVKSNINNQQRDTPISTISNESNSRFGNTPVK